MERKLKMTTGILTLMVLVLSMLAPVVKAADTDLYKATKSISVQKLQYKDNLTEDQKVTNDGRNFGAFENVLEAYDKSKYGDVTFSLYLPEQGDLDNDGNLTDKFNNYTEREAIADAAVGADGIAKFELNEAVYAKLAEKGVKFDTHFKVIIAEKTPAKEGYVIVQKAEPMVIELPLQDKTGVISDIKITAKNKVSEGHFKLLKKNEKAEAINNTIFDLYKGTFEDNKLVKNDLKLENGGLEIKGLGVGHYFLVEKESENVSSLDITAVEDNKNYMLSEALTLNAKNILGFTVDNNGIKIDLDANNENKFMKFEEENMTVTNYSNPTLTKINTSYEYAGGKAAYEIKFNVPANIFEYEKFEIVDTLPNNKFTLVNDSIESAVKSAITTKDENGILTFTFDVEELKKHAGEEITLKYNLNIPEDANGELINKAKILFKKNGTKDIVTKDTDPSKFTLYTAKVESKESITGKALPGAKFKIYSETEKKYYAGPNKWVEDEAQAKVFETTLNGNEAITEITGLKESTYKTILVEQPESYKMLIGTEVFGKIDLGADKIGKTDTYVYEFSKIFSLPKTGNFLIITIASLLVVSGAAYVVVSKKEKKNA